LEIRVMSAVRLAPRRLTRLVLATLALFVLGCSNSSDVPSAFARRFGAPPTSTPGPRADSPAGAVKLLQWCWESRSLARYREVFSDDFRFAFALADSVGNPYWGNPWTREDELLSAEHIFDASSSITLVFDGDLVPQPDSRPGKSYPWHQQVQVQNLTLTIYWNDGSGYRITGGGLFFIARGDSAVIPEDLFNRGFRPDMNRWYIERWEDRTNVGASAAMALGGGGAAAPSRSLPGYSPTWGRIKVLYR
jgi:hypothetical protein